MNKIMIEAAVTVFMFFAVWQGLAQIDWMNVFKVKSRTESLEKKLGELLEEQVLMNQDTISNPDIYDPIRAIIDRICEYNDVDASEIKLYIVTDTEINAFAMPNSVMVVNQGLISECENEEALAGVIGHELAHITEKHVMKRLIREIGLSVLINMTSGSGGGSVSQIAKTLTSSAYDRSMESEADMKAVEFLQKASINPEPFAEFMFFMSTLVDMPDAFEWISSHPESEKRSKAIVDAIDKENDDYVDMISDEEWTELQAKLVIEAY